MSFYPIQTQNFTLGGAGASIGDSTLLLSSLTDINGTAITMADLGSVGYGTIEPGSSNREEQISFTGITQNANGTATLTGVSTVIFKTPYTATANIAKSHPGGVVFVLSNTAGFYNKFPALDNANTFTAVNTFTAFPQKSGITTPTVAAEFATKAYVDAVAGGVATTNQLLYAGVAGENLTAGNVVYLLSSDGKWYKADSATASKSIGVTLGIAQSTVVTNAAVNVLLDGLDSNQTALTAGSTYYLSTSGAISTTKGANIRLIGRVPNGSTTTILLDTKSQNDTETLTVDNAKIYVTTTGAANAYVATLPLAISAYKTGQVFYLISNFANTGAATININGLGAKTIKKLGATTDLVANDILSGQAFQLMYDGTFMQLLNPVGVAPISSTALKFGGTGADGALTISSGVTTIDLANAAYVEKNYTSITISGTGSLAFSNPNTNGSVVVLRSQGNVTLTSSTAPMIVGSGIGAASQTDGWATVGVKIPTGSTAANGSATAGGLGGTGISPIVPLSGAVGGHFIPFFVGGGGGKGGDTLAAVDAGGAGGRGGGAIYIECGGAWNFTTAGGISVGGSVGTTGGNTNTKGGGGGGGGGGGTFVALYATLTANSGTITVAGGNGGPGGQGDGVTPSTGGAGGNGSSGSSSGGSGRVGLNLGAGGGGGGVGAPGGTNGSDGGGVAGGASTQGGSGGGGGSGISYVAANTYFL